MNRVFMCIRDSDSIHQDADFVEYFNVAYTLIDRSHEGFAAMARHRVFSRENIKAMLQKEFVEYIKGSGKRLYTKRLDLTFRRFSVAETYGSG